MPPRSMWTGQMRISLVSFGVRMYAATESATKVSMNQLHKDCHQRVRNQLVCPTHGPIDRSDLVKGYEYEKDSYVIITQDDLDAIKLESTKTIDLTQFVDEGEIDPLYVNAPYFLGPDGPVAEEAFRVIREALKDLGKVGLGKIVLRNREHPVAIGPSDRGFLMSTLRFASEVRSATEIFKDVKNGQVDKEQLKLAESIIGNMSTTFDPEQFHDQYQEAFFDVVKAKVEGEEPVVIEEDEAPVSYNFMEALQESVAKVSEDGSRKKTSPKKPAAKSVSKSKKKTRKRAS